MQATIKLNKKGLEKNGNEIGELVTSNAKHTLYYDFALGLFYRDSQYKVETLLTKVDDMGLRKISDEINKLRNNIQTIVTFNVSVWLREIEEAY